MAHPGAELYGSDRVLLETVQGLIDDGWEVVATVPSSGPLVDELGERGASVEITPTPVLRKSMVSPAGLLRLAASLPVATWSGVRLLRRTRPRVVVVNTVTIPWWIVLARFAGCRVLCHVHEAEGSASALLRRLLATPVLLAHQVVANSEFSRATLAASWPRLGDRCEIVYNGVVGPPDPPPPRSSLDGGSRLVYVGRLSDRKGVADAIDAVGELVRRGRPTSLDVVGAVFAGNESYEDHLRDAASRSGAIVRFHGFVDPVWPMVSAADVVVVPSRVDEPFGNTAVEAVLARRPVVVSATSGLLEASRGYETAVSVPPGSATAIADAVEALASRWSEVIAATEADLAIARGRHAPSVYRRRMGEVVENLLVSDR